jgi:TATA-box binding protein (TBP) (component of TFIID and TFIIIB)
MDQFKEIGRGIEGQLASMSKSLDARISTITSFTEINRNIDVPLVIKKIGDWSELKVRLPGTAKNKKRNHRSFFNSISVVLGGVCIKIFRTGLHITGCKSFDQICEVSQQILTILKSIHSREDMTIANLRIQLVNVVIDFQQPQDLLDLSKQMKNVVCVYERETYFGLKAKTKVGDRMITVLLFPSGNAVITGIKTGTELQEVCKNVVSQVAIYSRS